MVVEQGEPKLKFLGDGDNCFSNESLLSLVTPELCSLVEYWLAALRDLALLSLPPEFAHQLPLKGGAFYVPESIDVSFY